MLQSFTTQLKALYAQPFRSDMDAGSWFMFIGVLICCVILWSRIAHAIHLTR